MSQRNTLVRSLHDLGLGAWFGGSLMGAVGLNGATAKAQDPAERVTLSSLGWARWAPVNALAIGTHIAGSVGLIGGNKGRLAKQPEAKANTTVKTVVTGVALLFTAYSGVLGAKVGKLAKEGGEAAEGATEPKADSSKKLARAQMQLRVLQWSIPVLTGALVVMGAQQGEQQRPLAGMLRSLRR